MNVSIKDLNVSMEIKNKGIELDVYDGDEHLGDLIISKAAVIWCKGRTTPANGKRFTWSQFITKMNEA